MNNTVDTTKNTGQLAQVESYIGGTVSSPTKQFTQKFSYDAIGRLEKETETRGDNSNQVYQQKFSYDRFGNKYLKAQDNPANQNPLYPTPIEDNNIDRNTNRLAPDTNTLYDDAGNITTDGKYRNLKYFYDANGRMFKTSQTNDTNQANTVYDAGGQKVATKVNDVWRFLIYDIGGKLIAEYGGTDSTDQGGVKFIHQDLQGSTRCLTNLTGTVLSRMDYQAFGEEIPNNIGQRTAQGYGTSDSIRQRYGLTNRDEATGLDDTWFRKLEQRGGRWTSPDPYNGSMSLGNPQSFNRYSYVENQPTNFVDPNGLNAEAPDQACSYSGRKDSNGELIYDGRMVNGRCVSTTGSPVQVYWFVFIPSHTTPRITISSREYIVDGSNPGESSNKESCQSNDGKAVKRVGENDNTLALVGAMNSAASLALSNQNKQIQFFRDPTTGQFYGNPYRANKIFGNISKGTFGVGVVISGVQMANGDVSVTEGSSDILVGAIATFGGPKGWLVGGVYFAYKAIPPPRYPQGKRIISTNTCHR